MKETPINTLVSVLRTLSMFLGVTFFFIILVVWRTRCRYIYRCVCVSLCARECLCTYCCVRLSVYGSPYARVDVCKRVLLSACMCVCVYVPLYTGDCVCCWMCEWKSLSLSSPPCMRKYIRVRRCVQVSVWTNVAVCVCACVCKYLCALSVCMYVCMCHCLCVFVTVRVCLCVAFIMEIGLTFFFF